MKMLFLSGVIILSFSASSYAETSAIADQKETELEIDHDNVTIRDLEAEQKMAREQALVQEQIKKESEARLQRVRDERSAMVEKAKIQVSNWEARRKNAEKLSKQYTEESGKLTSEIKKLEESIAKAQQAAKDAEGIMAAGKEEVRLERERKAQLESQNQKALAQESSADAQMGAMRQQWAILNANVKDLEQKIAAHQEAAKRKQQLILQGQQKMAALQTKESQMKTQLGMNSPADPAAGAQRVPQSAVAQIPPAEQSKKPATAKAAPTTSEDSCGQTSALGNCAVNE